MQIRNRGRGERIRRDFLVGKSLGNEGGGKILLLRLFTSEESGLNVRAVSSFVMNIILFDRSELDGPFDVSDARVQHVLKVLRREIGDATDVGLIDGPRGKAVLRELGERSVAFDFEWGEEAEPLSPIDLIVGLSRPQTSRKVLQEATSLGVRSIRFIITDRGEPSYATSKLWTSDEWKKLVRAGVEQAFSTRFPLVRIGLTLEQALSELRAGDCRICMDNYEAGVGLLEAGSGASSVVLAVGSERGWSARERDVFREHGFTLAHLGERPLRTETATIASISVLSALLAGERRS
jgi:16S rRNA (uracil1498-N3)-methyltransferase